MSVHSVEITLSAKVAFRLTKDGRVQARCATLIDGKPLNFCDLDLDECFSWCEEKPTRFELYQMLRNLEDQGYEVEYEWTPAPLIEASLRGLIG